MTMDVVQETFVRAHAISGELSRRNRASIPGSIDIASQRGIDPAGANRVRAEVLQADPVNESASDADRTTEPRIEMDARELGERILAAIDELTRRTQSRHHSS